MRTSAEIGELAGALAKARGEMEQPACNRRNANFGRVYADLSAVQDAAVPALAKHGLAILHPIKDRKNKVSGKIGGKLRLPDGSMKQMSTHGKDKQK
jgi:hypothetical protein